MSVYERQGSPYLWLAYWCPRRMRRKCVSSGIRAGAPQAMRKALDVARKLAEAPQEVREESRWEFWVSQFFVAHYRRSELSRKRVEGAWSYLFAWLCSEEKHTPAAVEYRDAAAYIAHRTAMCRHSGKPIARNTAIIEIRVLSLLMTEAVRRGYVPANPLARPGLQRDPAREKPELTDGEIAAVRAELAKGADPEWMRVSFEVALHQGCRLRETQLDLHRDVDLARDVVTFRGKGGRVFATQLHAGLKPLLAELKGRGAKMACVMPPCPSKDWRFFFDRLGMGHLSFHCLRVTVITRLARAGVPVQQAMRFVGHADSTVHRIYQRLQAGDLGRCTAALSFGPGARQDASRATL